MNYSIGGLKKAYVICAAFVLLCSGGYLIAHTVFSDSGADPAYLKVDSLIPGSLFANSTSGPNFMADPLNLSPFAALDCINSHGERLQTTQCNPDDQEISAAGHMSPAVAAQHIANDLASGNYENIPGINSIFYSCMLEKVNPDIVVPDKSRPVCDLKELTVVGKRVESLLKSAAISNKPGASDAYLSWLFSSYQSAEKELELAQTQSGAISSAQRVSTKPSQDDFENAKTKLIEQLQSMPNRDGLAKSLAQIMIPKVL